MSTIKLDKTEQAVIDLFNQQRRLLDDLSDLIAKLPSDGYLRVVCDQARGDIKNRQLELAGVCDKYIDRLKDEAKFS